MALRSPNFLDLETLLSQADYYDVRVPRREEVVEKTVKRRAGGAKAGVGGFGVDGTAGSDLEYQRTYNLEPQEKAMVSKVIDSLISQDAVKVQPGESTCLAKDDLVEISGEARITAASLAGKMLFTFRRLLLAQEGRDLDSLFDLDVADPQFAEAIKQVYLENELLPIPLLLELSGTPLPQKVYINVRPDHFIDDASASRVEGEMRVLGSVSKLIDEDEYFSAEQWLLHDWEFLMKRVMMAQIDDSIREVAQQMAQMGVDLPAEDVHAFISGPAVVVDAIGLY